MACLIGKKVGMTQGFAADGKTTGVTVLKAGPCKVLGLRTKDKEGYDAAIVGFEEVDGAKVKQRALLGYFKKAGQGVFRFVREFRDQKVEAGATLDVSQFAPGDILKIEAFSKGRGWTSVIKKYNFGTGRESHGGNCQRKMGSAGMHTWPARVLPGKKMSGQWGPDRVTLRSVEVIDVVPEEHLLIIKGSVPGGKHGLVKIEKLGKKKAKAEQTESA